MAQAPRRLQGVRRVGSRLGSWEALRQMLLAPVSQAQGHWKCRCSSLYSVVTLSLSREWGWVWGPGDCIGISPSLSISNRFLTGGAGFLSPESALFLQSPHPSDTPSPTGPSLTFSLLPGPEALCKTIGAGKSDLQRLIKIRAVGREAESYNDGCLRNTCPEPEVLWAFGDVCFQPRSCAIVKHT